MEHRSGASTVAKSCGIQLERQRCGDGSEYSNAQNGHRNAYGPLADVRIPRPEPSSQRRRGHHTDDRAGNAQRKPLREQRRLDRARQ